MKRVFTLLLLGMGATLDADMLNFLYQTRAGRLVRPAVTRTWFSSLTGFLADSWISKYVIRSFVARNHIDLDEAVRKKPKEYRSFNDFFTRVLEPYARPICSHPTSISSPADGTLYLIENIQESTEFLVKGTTFKLARFLADPARAESFYGGTLMVIYLSPSDYHRFHAPFDSSIQEGPYRIRGKYESVNPRVFNRVQPLIENERQLMMLQSDHGTCVGFVAIGALCVGRISFTYPTEDSAIQKGQELGYFSFGGSTIVLLFPPDAMIPSGVLNGQQVKMGQCVGYFSSKK